MFRIERTPTPPPSGQLPTWVVDHDRNATLQLVATNSRETWRQSLLLTWNGNPIPFEVVRAESKDEQTGETFVLTKFTSFGVAPISPDYDPSVKFRGFASDRERHAAQLLAIEALLVFGSVYDGDKKPDGFHRVELGGKVYRKSDFGMT